KAFMPCRQHIENPLRHLAFLSGQALEFILDLRYGIPYPKCVPYFKRTDFPTKARTHGVINTKEIISNFRNAFGYIVKQRVVHCTKQFPRFIMTLCIHLHTHTDILYSFRCLHCIGFYFMLWAIFQGFEAQRQDLRTSICSLYFFIKTLLCLLTQPLIFYHFGDKSR